MATSRQSSGGKSFFSRSSKKDKEKRNVSEEGKYLGDAQSISSGSRSSRHNRDSSLTGERPYSSGTDQAGLNMQAGVITSIPYDSVSADSKSPIPVDYLPRSDQMPLRRDPLPHHLNKGGGDYHQYPSIDQQIPNGHPSGPRPPPGVGNVTMASTGNRTTQLQQWGPGPGSGPTPGRASSSTMNSLSDQRTYDSRLFHTSYSTTGQSSTYGRSSYEQSDTATERSSVFSSGSSSKTAIPNAYSQNSLSPSFARSTLR